MKLSPAADPTRSSCHGGESPLRIDRPASFQDFRAWGSSPPIDATCHCANSPQTTHRERHCRLLSLIAVIAASRFLFRRHEFLTTVRRNSCQLAARAASPPEPAPPSSMPLASCFRLVKGTIRNRWMVVVATFLIMACSGATYNFGNYSPEIKLRLHYNQETINTIGFFKDLGANVGILSGLLYDFAGPRIVLLCGGVLNLFGYLMLWLSVTSKVPKPPVWKMNAYICIGANSQAFTNTGVIVTSVKNFPHNRGLVVGLLKGYVGLSGAMLTLVYEALYGNQPASFILLVAWLPCVVCFSLLFIVRRMPPAAEAAAAPASPSRSGSVAQSERKIFMVFLYIALVLAAYLTVVIVVQHIVTVPQRGFQALAVLMVLMVLSPLRIVVREELKTMRNKAQQDEHQQQQKQIQVVATENAKVISPELQMVAAGPQQQLRTPDDDAPSCSSDRPWLQRAKHLIWHRPPRGSDYSIPEAVFSVDMMIIFVAITAGVGAGLMVIDNLGQIGAALGYSHQQTGTFVSLVSIWNFLGRVGSGFVSDVALEKYAVPRTFFFAIVIGVAAIGHTIMALNLPGALYAGSIIIGLTFGAQWALMFTVISELFGLKYYGTLYSAGGIASPLGSYLLSVRVAGALYDREAAKDRSRVSGRLLAGSDSALLCHGAHCYRTTFFLMAAVCVLGCFIGLVLAMRTRKFYLQVSRKMREQLSQQTCEDSPEAVSKEHEVGNLL